MNKRDVKGRKTEPQDHELIVDLEHELLAFLLEKYPDQKKKMKAVLAAGQVQVNGVARTQFNHKLVEGDRIRISWLPNPADPLKRFGIQVLYEDREIIAVAKPAGMLSVATEKESMNTVFRHVSRYVMGHDQTQRIFVVHRLDQDTSGVMVFARNLKLKELLQKDWNQLVTERIYYGVVQGTPEPKEGRMAHYLFEDKQTMVHISLSGGKGKMAVTQYLVEETGKNCALVRFSLETGRKNQIRVQMKAIGHPILGDSKYGSGQDPLHRLALHAHKLTITHPVNKQPITFQAEVPPEFIRLVKKGI